MASAAVCAHYWTSSAPVPVLQGKVENSCDNARWQRSNCTCGSSIGAKSGRVAMRSWWLDEDERRWQLGSRRSGRSGNKKGFVGTQQLQVRAGFDELLHNEVLVSSTTAGILGQLAKPIFLALRGRGFNWRLIYTSGGMPSTHSATVTAAATAVGIERGLSDSLFGLAVILASIVMYDAQVYSGWQIDSMTRFRSLAPFLSEGVQASCAGFDSAPWFPGVLPNLAMAMTVVSGELAPYIMHWRDGNRLRKILQGVRRSVGKQAQVINAMVFTHMPGSVLPQSALPTTFTPNSSPYAIGVELARDPVQAELAFMEDAYSSTHESAKSTAVLSKESSVGVSGTPSVPLRFTEEQSEANGAIPGAQIMVEDAENLPSVKDGEVVVQEIGSSDGWRHFPLKESVGHTKVEVAVGAIWGIVVALTLH